MTSDREANLLRVLTHTSRRFYVYFGKLSAVALWGVYGYMTQLRWGLNDRSGAIYLRTAGGLRCALFH
jgi:hypothetical protein